MRLLVTRPEPDGSRTGQALEALGHTVILSPTLDIVPDPQAVLPSGDFQAVLATSSNAVRALAAREDSRRFAAVPLFAVGDRSALEARRAGFAAARSAGGAIADLLELAKAELDPGARAVLYVAGDTQAGDLAGELRGAGFRVETAVLYRSVPRDRLSRPAAAALLGGTVDGVLLYSRQSTTAFAAALRAGGLAPLSEKIACFCLSAASADVVREVASGDVLIAQHPDQLSLFALVDRHAAAEEP